MTYTIGKWYGACFDEERTKFKVLAQENPNAYIPSFFIIQWENGDIGTGYVHDMDDWVRKYAELDDDD